MQAQKEKKYICSICGDSFAQRQGLHRHKKKHDGTGKVQCGYCGTFLARQDNLQVHLRTAKYCEKIRNARSLNNTDNIQTMDDKELPPSDSTPNLGEPSSHHQDTNGIEELMPTLGK